MPLMRGHSPEVVHNNIKEMIRSGYKPKQAIAASLANARKSKKMAKGGDVSYMSDGGQAVEYGGMGDMPEVEPFRGGDNESMEKMDRKGPEDYQRSLNEIREDGEYYPSEVANPNEMDEEKKFAMALRKKAMQEMSPESYAMGGLVQDGPAGDEPVGNKPSEDMDDSVEDQEVHAMVGKPYMKEPSGMGLSQEAMEALKKNKKKRQYSM